MKKSNPLLLASFVIILVYIAILKTYGITTFDFSDIIASIKPYLLHSLALGAAFVLCALATFRKADNLLIPAVIFALISAATFFPLSLVMLVPGALCAYVWWNTVR